MLTEVHLVKAMVFPVVMYRCESWTIKKAEHQRINAFELWCWRRLLKVPWTARISNPSIPRKSVLNIHWKDWHWCWNSSTWLPDVKNWLIEKDSDTRKDWRWEEKGTTEDEMVGWPPRLNGHEFEQASGVGDGQGSLACCRPWDCKESDMTEQQPNWRSEFSQVHVYIFSIFQGPVRSIFLQLASLSSPHCTSLYLIWSVWLRVCVCVCVWFFPLSFLQVYLYPSPKVPLSKLNRWIHGSLVGSLCFLIFP